MAGDRVTIGMIGGAPWGFRLYGGEADPLLVAKVRVLQQLAGWYHPTFK